MKPDILVVGTSIDPHIDAVLQHIPPELTTVRFDVDKFPSDHQLSLDQTGAEPQIFVTEDNAKAVNISEPDVVWFRRLGQPGLSSSVPDKYRQFCLGEADMALEGMLSLVKPKAWVNEYWSTRRAANKPYQYSVAKDVGLGIPDTLITNSPKWPSVGWRPAQLC
jgi:hypothetical protein